MRPSRIGFTLRGGRFFSAVGYLNQQHEHAWDFADAPLVYAGLWGNKYLDDGVRLSWVAPTRLLLELGAEVFAGAKFPAGGERDSGIGTGRRTDGRCWRSPKAPCGQCSCLPRTIRLRHRA